MMGSFGPDRNTPPGITPVPGQLPAQFTEFMVESAAMHSQSRGWCPAVVIRATTDDGAGIVGTLEVNEQFWEWVESIIEAGERALLDVDAGRKSGTLS